MKVINQNNEYNKYTELHNRSKKLEHFLSDSACESTYRNPVPAEIN